ncbi:MCE family protein [Nocardia sp. NPDC050630]|uniref:MCE family protein n=1 Tax=Nocardia sp. NPDC050630 TaxID=3364321 RepID=UPI0037BD6DA4
MKRPFVVVSVVLTVGGMSGCGWQGVNSLPLPRTEGRGAGSYEVRIELPDVTTVQRNSRVRVNDVTVGNVTKIELRDWHALVTVRLDSGVRLPANATATVGQTSLLGSTHIELSAPKDRAATGELRPGAVIPLTDAGAYPTTEQTLSALSVVLNGGGLGKVQEITQALNQAFASRVDTVRSLLTQLDTFIAGLNQQRDDIIDATENLDRLAGQVAAQQSVVDTALETIPEAIAVLSEQRTKIADAVTSIGHFSAVADSTISQSQEALMQNLQNLGPVLASLADSGKALTRSLALLASYPWPMDTLGNWVRGDYANLTAVIDLTLSRLDSSMFVGTPLEGRLTGIEALLGRSVGIQPSPATRGNPLVFPYLGGK